MDEKRRFVRLNVGVTVSWNKIGEGKEPVGEKDAMVKNISGAGICMIAYRDVKQGEQLNLEMTLPSGKKIAAKGRISWTKSFEIIGRESNRSYETGVEFIEIRDEDRQAIVDFVASPYKFPTL
jgi:hypothetical protein